MMAGLSDTNDTRPVVGLLTKTIVKSPVTKWILPARIRHRSLNDIILVGEDCIHLKQVTTNGHLKHITTKDDFDARIVAAQVFTIDDPSSPVEEDILQPHLEFEDLLEEAIPAQLLVLVLDCSILMFLYYGDDGTGTACFRNTRTVIPSSEDPLDQIGAYIAVDPLSRAIVLSSLSGLMLLYSAKPMEDLKQQLRDRIEDWSPVRQEREERRHLDEKLTVQHIAFLHPQTGDTDHVILLLVLVDIEQRRTKLTWLDWRFSLGAKQMQSHGPFPVNAPRGVSTLLIPLCNANFIVAYGRALHFYSNLLTGQPDAHIDDSMDEDHPPLYAGHSPRYPLWVNWCRPMKGRDAPAHLDRLYLVREDGKVFYVEIGEYGMKTSCSAGDFKCHVGQAFASFGDDRNPDLLAVAADMSTGRVVSIGSWHYDRLGDDRSRAEALEMKMVEHLPNWASITDLCVDKTYNSRARSNLPRDSIYICSGRQPYGSVTELRKGLEARLQLYIPRENLHSMLDIWAVAIMDYGAILFFLSTPESTQILQLDHTGINEDIKSFDNAHRTVAAGVLDNAQIVQVTNKGIHLTTSPDAGFESREDRKLAGDSEILCASIEPALNTIVWCERHLEAYTLNVYRTDTDCGDADLQPTCSLQLEAQPLCIATAVVGNYVATLITTDDQTAVEYFSDGTYIAPMACSFATSGSQPSFCDHAVLLSSSVHGQLIAVLSTRQGTLLAFMLDIRSNPRFRLLSETPFGQSTVKLVRSSSERDHAYAMCGLDTCLLKFDEIACDIHIENIWVADVKTPDLPQGPILGCARLPDASRLSSDLSEYGSLLVMISADELWLCNLSRQATVVPRQIRVRGSPFRMIYSHSFRMMVCASMVTEVTEDGHHRRCRPCIQFIPPHKMLSRSQEHESDVESDQPNGSQESQEAQEPDHPSFFMRPGERVHCLLEWSHISNDKAHNFVVVGSRYLHNSDERHPKGRICFLQLRGDGAVTKQSDVRFDDPVYALALYDSLTFVVCYGKQVALYRFSTQSMAVERISTPMAMLSFGSSITCDAPMVHVTTSADSLVMFRVQERQPNGTRESCQLVLVSSGPTAEYGLSHAIAPIHEHEMALMSTRDRRLLGLWLSKDHCPTTHSRLAARSFRTRLLQSIIKIRKANVQPAWRPVATNERVCDSFIGSCTDGSIIGLTLVNETTWRRLFWLQRLCEWSPILSPHSYELSAYQVEEDFKGIDRVLPIGLSSTHCDIVLSAPRDEGLGDMHIDGNKLAKILDHGGASFLRKMITMTSKRQDRVGQWVREHMEQELAAVDECISGLSVLLQAWL